MPLAVKTSLIPATANSPLDARTVVAALADLVNIENPYVGLEVYVAETGKKYRVTTLSSRTIGTQTVYAVGEYAVLPDMTDLERVTALENAVNGFEESAMAILGEEETETETTTETEAT